jgi:hypothetical protein
MENAKHIGGICALAVALGVGMAVANTPAVALAAPGDSGKDSSSDGSSSDGSSSSGSSRDSGSPSSRKPSAKTALSTTNDPASHNPRPLNRPGAVNRSGDPDTSTATGSSASAASTALTPSTSTSSTGAATKPASKDAPGADARQSDRVTSRSATGNTSVKTGPNPLMVNAPTADVTTRPSRRDTTRVVPAGKPSFVSTTPSAATTPADPLSRLVSTAINAVLSPFANSAPTAPVQSPAAWTLLAFARREFEQARTPSTIVNPPPRPINNGLVTDTVGVRSAVASPAADPGFISSTRNFFGLISLTSAGDPDDNNFVAVVLRTPFFTNILTSGADPEGNLGFGAAGIGVPGHTVNTFISPFLTFSIAIPVEDPFAELFIDLIRLGLV